MSAHPPPVPPANRSPNGPSATPAEGGDKIHPAKTPNNLGEQDRQGNTKQNTTHQGYQQDR